jgi:predicted Na+-dependent transporter
MAAQKHEFLANADVMISAFFVMSILFGLFYLFGFLFSLAVKKEDKVSFIYSSGAMNNSLAVGLAFAYFDAQIILFIVLSEVVWSAYVAAAQWWFSKRAAA